MNRLLHKDCGGEAVERRDLEPYLYDSNETGDPANLEKHYPYVCNKCNREILGDAEIDIEGMEDILP